LSALDTQAIKALAITMDDGLDLLGRSGGGSGGTSRASSEHGGASSEGMTRRREAHERALAASQQRPSSGSEYVTGIAKRVDRLIEVALARARACTRVISLGPTPALSRGLLASYVACGCEAEHDLSDGYILGGQRAGWGPGRGRRRASAWQRRQGEEKA